MKATRIVFENSDERKVFNQAAREQMKLRLLADIRADLEICELEGWDKTEYINDLQKLLNGFKTNDKRI